MKDKFDIRDIIVPDVPRETTAKVIKELLDQLNNRLLNGERIYLPKICHLLCKDYSARNIAIGSKNFELQDRKLLRVEALKTFRKKC